MLMRIDVTDMLACCVCCHRKLSAIEMNESEQDPHIDLKLWMRSMRWYAARAHLANAGTRDFLLPALSPCGRTVLFMPMGAARQYT